MVVDVCEYDSEEDGDAGVVGVEDWLLDSMVGVEEAEGSVGGVVVVSVV